MTVISLKKSKYYINIALVSLLIIFIVALIFGTARVPAVSGDVLSQRGYIEIYRDYLYSFGWETDETPVEISQVLIPSEFNETYKQYNDIQLSQGFDLTLYRGKAAVKFVFSVKNYPDMPDDGSIRATLLTYNGNIIGGDICSVRMDGFMHGFIFDNG